MTAPPWFPRFAVGAKAGYPLIHSPERRPESSANGSRRVGEIPPQGHSNVRIDRPSRAPCRAEQRTISRSRSGRQHTSCRRHHLGLRGNREIAIIGAAGYGSYVADRLNDTWVSLGVLCKTHRNPHRPQPRPSIRYNQPSPAPRTRSPTLTSFPPDLQTPLPIPMGGAFCLSGHSSGQRATLQDGRGIPMALPAFAILYFRDGFGCCCSGSSWLQQSSAELASGLGSLPHHGDGAESALPGREMHSPLPQVPGKPDWVGRYRITCIRTMRPCCSRITAHRRS
jgi:hypothetical protein